MRTTGHFCTSPSSTGNFVQHKLCIMHASVNAMYDTDERTSFAVYYRLSSRTHTLCRCMRMFMLRSLPPAEIVKECGYCMYFLAYWRRDIVQRAANKKASLQDNFITSETYLDVLCLCQCLILAIQWFRDSFPGMVFDPSRSALPAADSHTVNTCELTRFDAAVTAVEHNYSGYLKCPCCRVCMLQGRCACCRVCMLQGTHAAGCACCKVRML